MVPLKHLEFEVQKYKMERKTGEKYFEFGSRNVRQKLRTRKTINCRKGLVL